MRNQVGLSHISYHFHHNQIIFKGFLVGQSQLLIAATHSCCGLVWSRQLPKPLRFLFAALISCSVLPILDREGGLSYSWWIFVVKKMGGKKVPACCFWIEKWDFDRFSRTFQFPMLCEDPLETRNWCPGWERPHKWQIWYMFWNGKILGSVPSLELTYPTWEKGKSSSKVPAGRGYVSS